MAITLADFNKIWASTSPLTPYSFSESNYKQGWNFIGITPPARQMWDFLQKNNDEKMQYLANNYLPLSGGTMTGSIQGNRNSNNFGISNQNSDYGLALYGYNGSENNGATIYLNSKNRSSNAGYFQIKASDGTNKPALEGRPDGTLTWSGQPILYGNNRNFGGNGYIIAQNINTVIQWRSANVQAGTTYTWTYEKPFADNNYQRFVTTANNYTITTTATSMSITNNGSNTVEVNMLAIGLMAQ